MPVRHLASVVCLAGWAVVAGLGVLLLIRAFGPDVPSNALVALLGLGALPYLIALPIAVVALARRQRLLGVVALVVAAAIVPTALPEATARAALPAAARTAPRMRVLSWNLLFSNRDGAAIEAVVRHADADLVVFQEVADSNVPELRDSRMLAAYPYHFTSSQHSAFGSAIWSRLPLEGAEDFDVAGLPMARATVVTPSGPVRLVNVHTLSPVSPQGSDVWPRQLHRLGEEARRPGPPILLVGDFNATWGHRPFRRLLDVGLEDAAAVRGTPWSATWPAGRGFPPPVLRLDHVLTGSGLVATAYATGPSPGSDHRSILVDLALPAAGP